MKIPEKINNSLQKLKYTYMVQKRRHSDRVHRPFCDISLDEGQSSGIPQLKEETKHTNEENSHERKECSTH